jgi:hypothetical protein
MTLEELALTLPNGFHDTEIREILIDYQRRRIRMRLSVWIGDMEEVRAPKEAYRDADLVIEGLQFVGIEPPSEGSWFAEGHRQADVSVDLVRGPAEGRIPALRGVTSECFVSPFFVYDWNSHVYVAGESATLTWVGEMYDRAVDNP